MFISFNFPDDRHGVGYDMSICSGHGLRIQTGFEDVIHQTAINVNDDRYHIIHAEANRQSKKITTVGKGERIT